ncbi:MJ0042-type zinc finger domain-containing protein [Phenylobacterium sp.]|uniref:MJ0042-type zinc finger domain-containing protein n=1 Tax=Phenylobacterium sp. TaxID=1871053 RepID=UPI00286B664D|nr:DUF3426 domain-containing protein [Phenylobacterium sp.]
MILTCPECATSYFVDDSRISDAGRTVSCSNCGARWTALKEPAAAPGPESGSASRPQGPPPAPVARPPVDELVIEGPPVASLSAAVRMRASAPRREAAGKVAVWGASAAVIAALVAGLIVYRAQIVRLAPAVAGAYAGLGLPVNRLGLEIEAVHAQPTFQGGRPVLAVTGAIRNVSDAAALTPDLRISLLDRAGKPLIATVARPIDPRVPAHALRHFAIALVDPPAGVHDLEVTFEAAARPGAVKPGPPQVAEAVMSGPAPVDARPLAPGTPDALPPHD